MQVALYLVRRYCAPDMPQPEYSEFNFTCLTSNEWLVIVSSVIHGNQSHAVRNTVLLVLWPV